MHVDLDGSNSLADVVNYSVRTHTGRLGVDWSAPRPRGTVVARIRCHRAALAKTRWGDGALATLAGRDSALLKTTPRYPQTQIRIPLGYQKTLVFTRVFAILRGFGCQSVAVLWIGTLV